MSNINFQHLESFIAVADELSFSRAARKLGRSQSTISTAIDSLERDIGGILIKRSTRQVSLTQLGIDFLKDTRDTVADLRDVYNRTRLSQEKQNPILIIGHTPALGQLILPKLITLGHHDSLPWTPVLMDTHAAIQAVVDRRIDIGLCWAPKVNYPIISTSLAKCPFVVALRDDDPLTSRDTLTLSDIADRPVVILSRDINLFLYSQTLGALLRTSFSSAPLEEVPDYTELPIYVATQRSCVGLHPAVVATVRSVPRIQYRLLDEASLLFDITAVYRSTTNDAINTFISDLKAVTPGVIQRVLATINTHN